MSEESWTGRALTLAMARVHSRLSQGARGGNARREPLSCLRERGMSRTMRPSSLIPRYPGPPTQNSEAPLAQRDRRRREGTSESEAVYTWRNTCGGVAHVRRRSVSVSCSSILHQHLLTFLPPSARVSNSDSRCPRAEARGRFRMHGTSDPCGSPAVPAQFLKRPPSFSSANVSLWPLPLRAALSSGRPPMLRVPSPRSLLQTSTRSMCQRTS